MIVGAGAANRGEDEATELVEVGLEVSVEGDLAHLFEDLVQAGLEEDFASL